MLQTWVYRLFGVEGQAEQLTYISRIIYSMCSAASVLYQILAPQSPCGARWGPTNICGVQTTTVSIYIFQHIRDGCRPLGNHHAPTRRDWTESQGPLSPFEFPPTERPKANSEWSETSQLEANSKHWLVSECYVRQWLSTPSGGECTPSAPGERPPRGLLLEMRSRELAAINMKKPRAPAWLPPQGPRALCSPVSFGASVMLQPDPVDKEAQLAATTEPQGPQGTCISPHSALCCCYENSSCCFTASPKNKSKRIHQIRLLTLFANFQCLTLKSLQEHPYSIW